MAWASGSVTPLVHRQGTGTTDDRPAIKVGSLIRFRCQGDEVLTRVTKVAWHASFEEMFDHEPVVSVNPLATREDQLANIRQIYPPEREALGVMRSASNWSIRRVRPDC